MHDPETGTLWSQITGEAISGPLTGKELEVYPSTITTYGEFVSRHPDGSILAKPDGMTGSYYASYYADRNRMGIFGTENSDSRLEGKDKVIGLRSGPFSLAVAAPASGDPVLQTVTMGQESYWVFWDPVHHSAAVWLVPEGESVKRAVLETGVMIRGNDEAAWDALTGHRRKADGANLQPAPFLIAYWFAWKNFYPDTELVLP
jgi:hypothetical protein